MTQTELKGLVSGSSSMAMSRSELRAAEWSSPVWLPTPARPAYREADPASKSQSLSQLVSAAREGTAEKILMTILACAAVMAIGYGFLSLVESMENWPVFQDYVAQLTR